MPNVNLTVIAKHIGAEIIGDSSVHCARLSRPEESSDDALVICLKKSMLELTLKADAAAVVTTHALRAYFSPNQPLLLVEDAQHALTALLEVFGAFTQPVALKHHTTITHSTASIDASCHIEANVVIGAHSIIGRNVILRTGVVIGQKVHVEADCVIGERAIIMDDTRLGSQVQIGPGAVIGSTGFSVYKHRLRPHVGHVTIGDRTSIGANVCIDRGTIGATQIGRDVHIDNLVQIGHNCEIGDRVTLCGQVGLAGSVRLGDQVTVGGQAGFAQGVQVAPNTMIAAQAGVTKNLEVSGRYSGHPAELNQRRLRRLIKIRNLVKDNR